MKNLGSSFRKLLLTVTVGLGFMASAQAAVYVGSWDPKYSEDSLVKKIGWEGTVNFEVSGTCGGAGSFNVAICKANDSSFSATVSSANVTIYDWKTPETRTSFTFGSFEPIQTVTFDDQGKVIGFTGGFSNTVYDITLPPALVFPTDFTLFFDGTGPRMTYTVDQGVNGDPSTKSGINTLESVGGPDYKMTYSISAVPEASSLAMMIAGLGLVGFIGRKRKMRLDTATL